MAWSGNFDMSAWEGSDARRPMFMLPKTKPTRYQGTSTSATSMTMNMTKIQPITSLSAGLANVVICGVVLAKEEPKNIMSKKNPGSERYLLNFTIRDSPYDFINATCWGSKEYIQILAGLFHIGDIVEIANPQVQSKPNDGRDEKFRAITPGPFSLNISENHSTVKLYEGSDVEDFNKLHNIPVKASDDFYTLGDILANGQNISGETISILAGVRKVGALRDVLCKNGRTVKKCEVFLFDETCTSFLMTLWNEELANAAQGWIPKEHNTKEAYSLYQYAQTVDFSTDNYSFGTEDQAFDMNKVKTVYSVEKLKSLCRDGVENKEVEYGIVFAYLSSLNLDTESFWCIAARCNHCKKRMDLKTKICSNLTCPNGGFGDGLGDGPQDFKLEFNILVSISDHTGTLAACHLDTPYAEKSLGCSVDEYMRLSEEKKTDLKWKLLLEKCKIYVKVFLPSMMRAKAMVRVMSLAIADPMEAARNIRDSEI
ncbi:meiosis-specific with OB domain-containing protein-like isoform X2 [Lineus longissimus]|uniref:meiosis-specific with OB domain-containing protein-like isoform X2 n=1 Tax=Lineus longissimus TaxID=88925 RepID=UPI00315D8FAF